MSDESDEYNKGRTDTRLDVIEKELEEQKELIEKKSEEQKGINKIHDKIGRAVDRIWYGLLGVFGLIAYAAEIKAFFKDLFS